MAASKHVALVALKGGGKTYAVGEEVPSDWDDLAALKKAGLVGAPGDAKKLEKEASDSQDRVAELEAQVAELTAELEQAQLDLANANAQTSSPTDDDAAAAAAAEAEGQKKIGN